MQLSFESYIPEQYPPYLNIEATNTYIGTAVQRLVNEDLPILTAKDPTLTKITFCFHLSVPTFCAMHGEETHEIPLIACTLNLNNEKMLNPKTVTALYRTVIDAFTQVPKKVLNTKFELLSSIE